MGQSLCGHGSGRSVDAIPILRIKEPNQKYADLKNLGSRLKLPPGWKFRAPILEKDLVFTTDNGKTMITQDEIGNTYDRVGGPYSNYKP